MKRLIAPLIVVILIAVGIVVGVEVSGGDGTRHLTAYFKQTIGLYVGNSVDIMGVQVGKIDSLTTTGKTVKVEISYDAKYKLPSNVDAVLLTPSVVSDRYIQLQPVYTSGAVLADNAVIPETRTAIPLEFDDIFKNLDQLNRALGPNGANKHGALSRLLSTSYANLHGNGQRLHNALQAFTGAISTLSGNRGNLFETVTKLQQFTTAIAHDDGGVRALNSNLARVGSQLNNERHDLGAALSNLSSALKVVEAFVAQNKAGLTTDLHGFTKVSKDLQAESTAIKQIIDNAAPAVFNLALAGDNKAKTLDTKANLTEPLNLTTLCQTLSQNSLLGGLLGTTGLGLCS